MILPACSVTIHLTISYIYIIYYYIHICQLFLSNLIFTHISFFVCDTSASFLFKRLTKRMHTINIHLCLGVTFKVFYYIDLSINNRSLTILSSRSRITYCYIGIFIHLARPIKSCYTLL